MQINAAVSRTIGTPLTEETLTLDSPRANEILVRIVATGICHSDISVLNGLFPPAPPIVAGHEGAGVVAAIGEGVTHVVIGDHVVLSFNSCGECATCRDGHVAYCENFYAENQLGSRVDGSATLHDKTSHVHGNFFGQSSFASYALANKRNTVKVPKNAPLELLGPLGCGFMTGAATVINVLKPAAGASLAVFGCGGVGLAAIMAAKIAGCAPIIAIDRFAVRLELARELGATHTIDASREDVASVLAGLGGVKYSIEASGGPGVLEIAFNALKPTGICCSVGLAKMGTTVTLDALSLLGRTLCGVVEGDANPHEFIPWMVEHYLEGVFPIDKLIKIYPFREINEAIADSISGQTVKPVLRMPGNDGEQISERRRSN